MTKNRITRDQRPYSAGPNAAYFRLIGAIALLGCVGFVAIVIIWRADNSLNGPIARYMHAHTAAYYVTGITLSALIGLITVLSIALLVALHKLRTLADVVRERDEFTSMLLHHIRTPLTGIKWLLAEKTAPDSVSHEVTPADLQTITKENERAIGAVEHLLDALRANTERMEYHFTRTSARELSATIRETAERFRSVSESRGIQLVVNIATIPENAFLSIDEEKIRIALEALFNNAAKYTNAGGTITVSARCSAKEYVITLADTGIGIPVADQGKIFTQFFRASNAHKKEPDGFGIGLFVAKLFIEKHAGSISFTSKEGAGTSFLITLPTLSVGQIPKS